MDMSKLCSTCLIEKPTSEFYRDSGKAAGLRSQCKSCANKSNARSYYKYHERNKRKKREYQRGRGATKKWRSKTRIENRNFLARELGLIWECSLCGFSEYPEAIDFHHINPDEKRAYVGILLGMADRQVLLDEAKKCILVCANCHRHVHHG